MVYAWYGWNKRALSVAHHIICLVPEDWYVSIHHQEKDISSIHNVSHFGQHVRGVTVLGD